MENCNKRQNKIIPLSIKVTPALKEALESACRKEYRTIAGLTEMLLVEYCKKYGHISN